LTVISIVGEVGGSRGCKHELSLIMMIMSC
jgi:hypothetical protein